MKRQSSATQIHPPPDELTSVVQDGGGITPPVEVSNEDINDIDRVLAELRSVTKEDDKVGYSYNKTKK